MSPHVPLRGLPPKRGGEKQRGVQEERWAGGRETKRKKVRRNGENHILKAKGGVEEGERLGIWIVQQRWGEGRGKVGHGQSCSNFFSSFLSPWKKPQEKKDNGTKDALDYI